MPQAILSRQAAAVPAGWHAELELAFERRAAGTVLLRNRHIGPLMVQKALYPEDPATCHVAVLHPPGGIAAGDRLFIETSLKERSRALLTTPGATKWYRSEGAVAEQSIRFEVAAHAVLEWLPRENIFFDRSRVATSLHVELAPTATYVGWEILSFGRRASGESWNQGSLKMRTAIRCGKRLLWSECAALDAGSGFAASNVGLSGFTVCGTLVLAGHDIDQALLGACRATALADPRARVGITRLPAVMVARYLGDSSEEVFDWFKNLWALLRPVTTGRAACPPRVWAC